MACFSVVERELRVASRRRGTFRVRSAAVLGMLAYFAWQMLDAHNSGLNSNSLGRQLFGGFALLAFIYSIFIGPFATSDCVSEEKRDGTLGLGV